MKKKKDREIESRRSVSAATVESELKRMKYRKRFGSALGSTVSVLITVAAAALLIASLWMPVFRVPA